MAKPKKKLLPKDFEETLKRADLPALQSVFESCEFDARGGFSKHTTLAFGSCPDELARWLVARGADVSAPDQRGETPLHARARSRLSTIDVLLELGADPNHDAPSVGTPLHAAAGSHHVGNARLLIARGAEVDRANGAGLTALELALRNCSNINLEDMAPLAETLLGAGAKKTARMKAFVAEIGKRFEFHRAGFNPDSVDAASAGLDRLYELFDVAPEQRRVLHDGASPIAVSGRDWREQHQGLWELLVPSSGPAATAQGEAIRISGRITRELDGNGGANWDADFRKMADAFLEHMRAGEPLPPQELAETAQIVADVKRKSGDVDRMMELAVAWVLLNPTPIRLTPPPYRR